MKTRTIRIDDYKVIIRTNENVNSNYGITVHIADSESALVGKAFKDGTKDVALLEYAVNKINQFNNTIKLY